MNVYNIQICLYNIMRGPTTQIINIYILNRTNELLVKVITQMHDNNASAAKFKTYFNGDTKNTIRFIFATQRFNTISRFMDPESLFIAIYINVLDPIKTRFAADEATIIARQRAQLTEYSNAEDRASAKVYSMESMQAFFMTHYRPSLTRGNIFRHLLSIRMRYNENPREVLDRVVQALSNARKTIILYNSAGIGVPLDRIRPADRTLILTTIFCTKNNCAQEKNEGGINASVQKRIRDIQLQYDVNHAYRDWYLEMDAICVKVGGIHYSGDERCKYVHQEPQILELWDKPSKTKPKTHTRKPKNPLKRKPLQPQSPRQPKPKRPRFDPTKTQRGSPNTPSYTPKSKCFRCGKRGHHFNDCRSRWDVNGQEMFGWERRILSKMPFRGDHKPPKSNPTIRPQQPRQPRNNPNTFRTRNYRGGQQQGTNSWPTYPSTHIQSPQQNPMRNVTPQRQNPNHNQPQINALLAQITADAQQDSHTNPSIITNLQQLATMMASNNNPDNTNTGHHHR